MILQSINSNINNIQENNYSSSTTSVSGSEIKDIENLKQLLDNTSSGDYLKGTIVSKNGNDIVLSLSDNTLVNAKLSSGIELNVGASVVFSVRSSDSNGLSLSPLFTNLDNSSTLNRALDNAGLVHDDRNLAIVDSMMREGMNISRNEIIDMAKTLSNVSINDIPSAVSLTKLGITPTQDNILQFHSYLNYEHSVSTAMDDIMNYLPETIGNMISSGETAAAITMTGELFDIFTSLGAIEKLDSDTIKLSGLDLPVTEFLDNEQVTELTTLLNEVGIDPAFGEVLADGGVSLYDVMFVIDDVIKSYAEENNLTDIIEEETPAANIQDTIAETVDESQTKLQENNSDNSNSNVVNNHTSVNNFESSDFLKKLFIARNTANSNEVTGAKDNPEPEKAEDKSDKITRLITSKSVTDILKAAINKQWKLTENQVGEDKQVSNLYKRITEQTGRLLDVLQNHSKADTPLGQESAELSRNLNFMNELNNMFNYVQLPMKLSGNDAHGELYVYTNKKHMASEDGSVSALLHLDMENLGPTDVYVAMNSTNHVNTHFYLPDEESLDLIALHIDELTERLNNRGYQMTAEMTMRDDSDTNVMKEILEDNKSFVPVSFSNFDAKA